MIVPPQAAPFPTYPVPSLNVPLVHGGRFVLGATPAEHFDLLVFYRGLHCPVCAKYLLELERLGEAFIKRGVVATAISCDVEDRALQMAHKVKAVHTRFAYGLSLRSAQQWGLYISESRGMSSLGVEEPALFSEPGLFLVRPDGTLYYGSVQTMPFVRPQIADLPAAIDFVLEHDYPARGEYMRSL